MTGAARHIADFPRVGITAATLLCFGKGWQCC